MKRFFFLLLLCSATVLPAQKSIDRLSDATCNCLVQSQVDTVKTSPGLEKLITTCMMSNMMADLDRIMKDMKLKEFNADAGREIGTRVGMKMATTCPKFMQAVSAVREAKVDSAAHVTAATGISTGTVQGTITKIDSAGFVWFTVKEADGSLTRLLWCHSFAPSADLIKNYKTYVGRNVKIGWQLINIWLPDVKGYYDVKEMTSFALNP